MRELIGNSGRGRTFVRSRSFRFAAFLVLAATAAFGFPNEPRGIGRVRLGMTPDEVQAVLPALHSAPGEIPPAHLTFREAEGLGYLGRTCKGRFAFFERKLYEIGLDCGRDDTLLAALEQEYGKPARSESYGIFWYGEKVNVSMSPGSKVVGIAEPTASDLVQRILYRLVLQEQQKQQQGQAPAAGGGAAGDRPGEQRPGK